MTHSVRKRPIPKRPIKHGTLYAYNNYYCRCPDCKAAMREYQTARRGSRPGQGTSVGVNGGLLRARLDALGMTDRDANTFMGLGEGRLQKIIARGTAGFYTLDRIACALGCHMSEFLTDPKEVYGWEVTGSDLGED